MTVARRGLQLCRALVSKTSGTEHVAANVQNAEPSSVSVLLELAPAALANQASQIDALDTKAGFILGSSSLLTGVLTTWRVPLHAPELVVWLLPIIALVVYGVVIYCGYKGYALGTYHFAPSPVILWEDWLDAKPYDIRRQVLSDIAGSYSDSEQKIKAKEKWVDRALKAFALQAIIVAAIILLETCVISH